MLSAILDDWQALEDIEVSTLVAPDFPHDLTVSHQRVEKDERQHFFELASQADYTLVIAPEFDDLLQTRAEWVLSAGGKLLSSGPHGIWQTADKLHLAQLWKEHKVRTPLTRLVGPGYEHLMYNRLFPFPVVIKPRYGAGSQGTVFLPQLESLRRDRTLAPLLAFSQELVVQPYVSGLVASVAFLVGPNAAFALPPARQLISDDGTFTYLGGEIPLSKELRARAISLAQQAVECVSGLRGYVGVDLILGEPDDGSQDYALEINPRLTTSYIGLRQLAKTNLAEAMLKVVQGERVSLSWKHGFVSFRHDGTVDDSSGRKWPGSGSQSSSTIEEEKDFG